MLVLFNKRQCSIIKLVAIVSPQEIILIFYLQQTVYLFPVNSSPCNREKSFTKKEISIKKKKQPSLAVKGCGQMHKCSGEKSCEIHTGGNQKMAVMIGQWQNFNNNNSGKLGADSQLSWNEVT